MSESSLTLTYTDLMQEVGWFLGYGRKPLTGTGCYTDDELADLQRCVDSGYRQFLYPPPLRDGEEGHDWSFLAPEMTITVWPDVDTDDDVTATGVYDGATYTDITASEASFYESMVGKTIVITGVGSYTIAAYTSSTAIKIEGDHAFSDKTFSIDSDDEYLLPDDFGGFIGDLTYSTEEAMPPVRIIGESLIRRWRGQQDVTGKPRYAAVRPANIPSAYDGASKTTRWELMIWPTPDATYTLAGRYNVLVNALSSTYPYPVCPMEFAEVLLESCLAVAERTVNEDAGIHSATFDRLLRAAVSKDRRMSTPPSLGYCADYSDGNDLDTTRTEYVTYNGVRYNT